MSPDRTPRENGGAEGIRTLDLLDAITEDGKDSGGQQ